MKDRDALMEICYILDGLSEPTTAELAIVRTLENHGFDIKFDAASGEIAWRRDVRPG